MFYILAEENELLMEKYDSSELVSNMGLWADIDILSDNVMPGQICPVCKRMFTNYHWGPQRKAKFYSSRFPDMIIAQGSGLIFSEKAKNLITANNLSGILSFDKIDIVGKHLPSCDYYDTIVSFAETKIDRKHSVIKRKDIKKYTDCELCGLFIDHAKKIYLESSYYENIDIFHLYAMPYRFIVSERFYSIFSKENIANMRFIPMSDYSF